ncbi:MAG: hypothetical protein ACRDMX_03145 [Solirubrobacteraceae bacterium]
MRRAGRLVALAALIGLALAAPATAATARTRSTIPQPLVTGAPALPPTLVSSRDAVPKGFRHTPAQVLAIARADPRVRAALRGHPHATPYEYTRGAPNWQVSWFSDARPAKEILQVYVDDDTGGVTQVWAGFQIAWTMARGYPGAFGRQVNAWYVWIGLCLLFMAPFLSRRLTLVHLDLAVLLGFSISLAFFNHGMIGLSVPLVYPFLIYLLVRMLLLANRRGLPRRPLASWVPDRWLGAAAIGLMGFRIGLNVLNSNVIDVGFAGVIGADKLVHGQPLYGGWPKDNMYGDTYGPFSYYAYVPFRLIFGWSGAWDSLPAAHAASICIDVLAFVGLFVLGRRLRGVSLGVLLSYCWAAYPFTLYALESNTNDSLVAVMLVLALLVVSSAPARGVVALLAGMTKFAPFALAPLLLRGSGKRPRERSVAAFVIAFAVAAFVVMLPVLLHSGLSRFWQHSIVYQSDRVTPFSVWGLWGGLGVVQHLLQGAVIALALGAAFLPERRGPVEVAALSAAILIALQLVANYWLYPYVVWFFPMVIVALLAGHPTSVQASVREWVRRPPEPVASGSPG